MDKLTNRVAGQGTSAYGRMSLERDRLEVYEAARVQWGMGANREKMQYAMSVFDNVVQEIHEIERWQPSGTDFYATRPELNQPVPERHEFVGRRGENEALRQRYIGGDVKAWFPKGYAGTSVDWFRKRSTGNAFGISRHYGRNEARHGADAGCAWRRSPMRVDRTGDQRNGAVPVESASA